MQKTARHLEYLLRKASGTSTSSKLHLWALNLLLKFAVPFNKAHGLKVKTISDNKVIVILPYKKRNLNHLRSLHACALATAAEFATGLLILKRLCPTEYRIIMSSMKMEYYFQGKSDAEASFEVDDSWEDEQVVKPLESNETSVVSVEARVKDKQGEHLCTGTFEWQIKPWSIVRTTV